MNKRILDKTLRSNTLYDMKQRIKYAEQSGYKLVGRIVETMEGTFQAFMRKEVVFKERK